MNEIESAAVYRICAVGEHQWDVLQDSSDQPVASFSEKHAALAYAMSLARKRAGWQLSVSPSRNPLDDVLSLSSRPRGPSS